MGGRGLGEEIFLTNPLLFLSGERRGVKRSLECTSRKGTGKLAVGQRDLFDFSLEKST